MTLTFDLTEHNPIVRIDFEDGNHTVFKTIAEFYAFLDRMQAARRLLAGLEDET